MYPATVTVVEHPERCKQVQVEWDDQTFNAATEMSWRKISKNGAAQVRRQLTKEEQEFPAPAPKSKLHPPKIAGGATKQKQVTWWDHSQKLQDGVYMAEFLEKDDGENIEWFLYNPLTEQHVDAPSIPLVTPGDTYKVFDVESSRNTEAGKVYKAKVRNDGGRWSILHNERNRAGQPVQCMSIDADSLQPGIMLVRIIASPCKTFSSKKEPWHTSAHSKRDALHPTSLPLAN